LRPLPEEPLAAKAQESPCGAPRGWMVLGLCSLLFISSQFHRVSNAIIAVELREELGISAESLGVLSASFFYSFAAMQVPLALFLDRLGGRLSMGVLSIVGAAGALVFSMARGMEGAVLGRILLGAGMAGNLMGSLKLISNWFPPQQFATLSGLLLALGTLGNMLAATPLAMMVENLGWRLSIGLWGLGTGLLALIFLALVRERPPHSADHGRAQNAASTLGQVGLLLRLREYWLISLATFFRYGTFVAIQGLWAGPYLIQVLGLAPVTSGNILVLLNLGLVLGSPLGGILSDRWIRSRKRVVLMGLGVMAAAQLTLAMGWCGRDLGWLGFAFMMLGISSAFGQVMYAHIKELVPAPMTGMALTGINLFTMLGAASFLQGLGWVVDRWIQGGSTNQEAYMAAFLAGFGGVALAFLLYLPTREANHSRLTSG
jgi:nitrate/nitrite transporter NarK